MVDIYNFLLYYTIMPVIPNLSTSESIYALRVQSSQFDGVVGENECNIGIQLKKDLADRVCEAGHNLVDKIFPDDAFGFSINGRFMEYFNGIFLTPAGTINSKNFITEVKTAALLNRLITTAAHLLRASGLKHVKPLRYFSSLHANTPIPSEVKRKPDIVLLRLVDDVYIRTGLVDWKEVQALVELTTSKDVPTRMAETVTEKNYLMFCAQPDKDFIISICMSGSGFQIVVSDHAGQIDTNVISYETNPILFLRMVMGFAFLPDKWLGIDTTIIRRISVQASSESKTFESMFPTLKKFDNASIDILNATTLDMKTPFAITKELAKPGECTEFDTITIDGNTYKVLSVLFHSPSFIGRSTRVFLVRLPDGRQGVLKDSFITIDRRTEVSILKELTIPFGPEIIDHCILGNTASFRQSLYSPAKFLETREKRRIVTYPAGVHISDFSSLWELMVVFLDVAVGMSFFGNHFTVITLTYILIAMYYLESRNLIHRDISYTNILIRSREDGNLDSAQKDEQRHKLMDELGLSEIEDVRKKLCCREGLLIDFDYASFLLQGETGETEGGDQDESRGGSQGEILVESLPESQASQASRGESQASEGSRSESQASQANRDESQEFGVGEDDVSEDGVGEDSRTVIQPTTRKLKFSGVRTVCYFNNMFALQILIVVVGHPSFHCSGVVIICTTPSCNP